MKALNPVTTAVVAGALVVGGKWARNQSPTMDNAIGIAGIALGLSVLETMNEQLASAFSVLIIVSLTIAHFPAIANGAGFGSKKKGADAGFGTQGPGIKR